MRKLILLAAICAVGLCAACSDDDEPKTQGVPPEVNVEKLIQGSYWVAVPYFLLMENGQKVQSDKALIRYIGDAGWKGFGGGGYFQFIEGNVVRTYCDQYKPSLPMVYSDKYTYIYDGNRQVFELKTKDANTIFQTLQVVVAEENKIISDSPLRDQTRKDLAILHIAIPENTIGLRTVCVRITDPADLARLNAAVSRQSL